MRTTITLESDVELMVKRLMKERGLSFKEAVNTGLREALGKDAVGVDFSFTPMHLGAPKVALEHALRLAGELEDEELIRKLAVGR